MFIQLIFSDLFSIIYAFKVLVIANNTEARMEYAKGPRFAVDFALRTRENLELLNNSPYDVTQLINSLIGLLIIPRDYGFRYINDDLLEPELRNAVFQCVNQNTYPSRTTLHSILTHMRNAVCHSRMKFHVDTAGSNAIAKDIKTIEFNDRKNENGNVYRFQMEISVELLQKFVYAFSTAIGETL